MCSIKFWFIQILSKQWFMKRLNKLYLTPFAITWVWNFFKKNMTSTPLLLSNPTLKAHLLPLFTETITENNYDKIYLSFSGFSFLVKVFSFCLLLFTFLRSTAVTIIIIGSFCFGAILVDLEFKHHTRQSTQEWTK